MWIQKTRITNEERFMNILVVPTIREYCIQEFLDAWKFESFHEIIIVEDNPEKTFKISDHYHHYSWKEISA